MGSRDGKHAVEIRVEQITGMDLQSGNFYGSAKIHNVHVGVRDREISGETGQAHLFNCGNVPYTAICHDSNAAELLQNRRMHFTNEGAHTRPLIHVLNHNHSG